MTIRTFTYIGVALHLFARVAFAQVTADAPTVRPDAIVNLATDEGAALVRGQWRYHDARIIEVEHRNPGPDLRPSGPPNRTYDITPHAGANDVDDAAWEAIAPAGLEARRSNGRRSSWWGRKSPRSAEREKCRFRPAACAST